jgi:hypothetical protein
LTKLAVRKAAMLAATFWLHTEVRKLTFNAVQLAVCSLWCVVPVKSETKQQAATASWYMFGTAVLALLRHASLAPQEVQRLWVHAAA